MAMPVTVRDIAKRLNIGKSTVGYALNGGSKHVSEELRTRVLETAREMGYRPNETARALAKGKTNLIGVVPFQLQRGSLNSPFMRIALGAVYDAAEDEGRHVLLFTGYDPRDAEAMRSRFFESRVDGIVLIAPKVDSEMLSYIAAQNLPLAVVAGPSPGPGIHLNADNAGGVAKSVSHLVQLGHRRIGTISGPQGEGDGRERFEAFLSAIAAEGLSARPGDIREGDFHFNGGYREAKLLLAHPQRPTAIVCGNDQMAFGVLRAAREKGLEVPKDLSVIGFDDDELSAHILPSLTTVRQPIAEMAATAVRAIVEVSEGKSFTERLFSTELIVRASTGPAPKLQ